MSTYRAEQLAIADCTDCDSFNSDRPTLADRVNLIERDLVTRIEGLGRDSYPTCCAWTPQKNLHVAYANGHVKPEGASVRVKLSGLTVDEQVKAFQEAADDTFRCIKADKPEGRDLLLWRCLPQFKRELHADGLHLTVYVRLGWDAI